MIRGRLCLVEFLGIQLSMINCALKLQDAEIGSAILEELELFGWKEEEDAASGVRSEDTGALLCFCLRS